MRNNQASANIITGPAVATRSGPLRNPAAQALLAVWLVFTLLATMAGPALGTTRSGEIPPGGIDREAAPSRAAPPVRAAAPVRGTPPVRDEGRPLRPPSEQGIELELVQGVQSLPDTGPPVVVPAVAQPPQPGEQLVGNEFGCSATCITEALLHQNPLNANIDFTMTTTVSTSKYLWVLPAGPFIVNGFPAHYGVVPTAQTAGGHDWAHNITGLSHDTAYRIIITAVDNQGNAEAATTIVTTSPEPPMDLVGNGSGCYYDCIETGIVTPGASFDVATIELTANTDVDFEVFVSTDAPFEINGNPALANQINLDISNETSSSLVGQLTGLAGDTTYHVVVTATDENGFVHYAVGSFHTDDEPVAAPAIHDITVGFEKIHVQENGDNVLLGEITFSMGIGPNGAQAYWQTGQQKLADGDTYTTEYETVISVEEGAALPQLVVNAAEKDIELFSGPNTCGTGQTLFVDPIIPDCASGTIAIAAGMIGGVTVESIDTMLTCDNYGVPAYKANRKCMLLLSKPTNNNDYVEFEALLSFDVN